MLDEERRQAAARDETVPAHTAQEDYQKLHEQEVVRVSESVRREQELERLRENRMLRTAIRTANPLILQLDLAADQYSCIACDGFIRTSVPASGGYDDMIVWVSEFLMPAEREGFLDGLRLENLRARMADAREFYQEFRQLGDDGQYHWLSANVIHVDPLEEEGRDLAVLLVRILDEERAEKARQQQLLKDALADAKAANLAKSDFLSRMSHEIRTPMNAIIGMSDLGLSHAEDPAQVRRDIQQIRDSGQYLLGLLNDILDVSRIESGEFELHPDWHTARDLFTPILTMITPLMEAKHIEFVHLPPGDYLQAEFYCDKMRIQQLFINLLNNACKFTPPGGRVCWTSEVLRQTDSEIRSRITVRDTGCGMSPGFVARIGEPFAQERNVFSDVLPGTGLGLYIVKKICAAMDISFRVESAPGAGTAIFMETARRCRKRRSQPRRSPPAAPDLSSLRVLVVEDNQINSRIARSLLERKNVLTEAAENGSLAVERFSRSAPGRYDAILMDVQMPVMNGLEAARAIRALDRADAKTVPIIAMTANAFDTDVRNSLGAGMNAHLSKPINTKLLYGTLARLTGRRPAPAGDFREERADADL